MKKILKNSVLLILIIINTSCQKPNDMQPNQTKSIKKTYTLDGTYIRTSAHNINDYVQISDNGKKLVNPFWICNQNLIGDTLYLFVNWGDSTFIIPDNKFWSKVSGKITNGQGKILGDSICITWDYENHSPTGIMKLYYSKQ